MHVRLISYSKVNSDIFFDYDPDVGGVDHSEKLNDVQELIAFCARVSNPSNQINTETSEKLVRYLIKHQHWSPLEMVSACLEIETTRDIARQILRHRSFSFQEFSQRYANPISEIGNAFTLREARFQDTKNRQNSVEFDMTDEKQKLLAYEWERAQKRVLFAVEKEYKWAIENGIAKEQARAVLPEGLTVSRLYMNGTLRSWVHFIQLRSANGTQKEHQLIAKECATVIAKVFPMANEFVEQ